MKDPFRPWRRAFRNWKKAQHLRQEHQRYSRSFTQQGLTIPDDSEIRRRIAPRFPGKVARPKGQLHILAIYHNYNWEGPAFESSLSAFGTVLHVDWMEPSLADGLQPGEPGWMQRMNKKLIEIAHDWNAERPFDAIFTYLSAQQAGDELLAGLRSLAAPVVNLALNDKEAFVGRIRKGRAEGARDICRHFDLCWTSTLDAVPKYVVEGATPLYLPEGANPLVHRPFAGEMRFDVSFVGQCYGNRPSTIRRLRAAGIRVEAFGPGWPNGPLGTEDMVRTWSQSRINLGFGGVAELKNTYCLKARDFEIPMSGGLYLTEHHAELEPFYNLGSEIVTYSGSDELLGKIRHLLSRPDEAESIRRAGRARALRDHTWEQRFDRVFRLASVL
jgi:spore maturation protein CgeB